MKAIDCPKCSRRGKSVKAVTLHSLLNESAKSRIEDRPYRFCQSETCPVVYFDESAASVFEKDDLTVRVGIKETSAPRPVCYCFDHSVEEIEEQVAQTGQTNVLDDIRERMQVECWCETKSPMGSCCLGTVGKFVKAAEARAGTATANVEEPVEDCCSATKPQSNTDSRRRLGFLASAAAGLSAILSSACCWLPLLLIGFGASAAGVAGFFETYRFWFLGATAVFLGIGFYLLYFRKPKCAPSDACAAPNPKLQRFNRIMLWCSAAIVVAFAFFPTYSAWFAGAAPPETMPEGLEPVSLKIDGMTCASCATTLERQLAKVEGIGYAKVDYDRGQAILGVDGDLDASAQAAIAKVQQSGFVATFQSDAPEN